MSKPNFLSPDIGHQKDEITQEESALFIEHSVQLVGDKAIWAVVSDFNSHETMRMLSVVCSAFKKLGRGELANRLWAEAKKEDFGLNPLAKQEAE